MLSVQCLGPVHEAHFLWGYKAHLEQDLTPILAPGLLSPTTTELGSMAPPPAQPRRSSRQGRGLNGRDVQLDNLGDILTAPTRQAKKQFTPSDGLSLSNNLLAPVQKKRCRKKVIGSYCPLQFYANSRQAKLLPPTASPPCEQPLSNIDPRLGFHSQRSSPTPLSHTSHPEAPAQPPLVSSPHVSQHSSPRLSTAVFPTHPSRAPTPLPNNRSSQNLNNIELDGDTDVGQDNDDDMDQDDDLDIDECSDGEDDHAAHEFLRAVPTTTNVLAGSPSAILPYSHSGFAVIFLRCIHYLHTLTGPPSLTTGIW